MKRENAIEMKLPARRPWIHALVLLVAAGGCGGFKVIRADHPEVLRGQTTVYLEIAERPLPPTEFLIAGKPGQSANPAISLDAARNTIAARIVARLFHVKGGVKFITERAATPPPLARMTVSLARINTGGLTGPAEYQGNASCHALAEVQDASGRTVEVLRLEAEGATYSAYRSGGFRSYTATGVGERYNQIGSDLADQIVEYFADRTGTDLEIDD